MRSIFASRFLACLTIAATVIGCTGKGDAPKVPLDQVQGGAMGGGTMGGGAPVMGGEAKAALDSANILYRAKKYDLALAQYQASARLAPMESAPLLGILMVADVTKNKTLADATLAKMKALNPSAADSSMTKEEILDIHGATKKADAPPAATKKK
jgi:hypothetical protein